MAKRFTAVLLALMMATGSLLTTLAVLPAPAMALTYNATTTQDFEGTLENGAVLDDVVVEDGSIKLDTEVYLIDDTQWSEINANDMEVDGRNIPRLSRASHWITYSGFNSDGLFQHSTVWDSDSNQVLVYGGRRDQGTTLYYFNHLYAYDPSAHSWTQLQAARIQGDNKIKYLHSAVWAGSEHMMIVFGGGTLINQQRYLLNETICYWPASNTWGYRAPAPRGLIFHAAAWDSTHNQMLVVGGTPDGNISNSTGDVWSYRPSTDSWSLIGRMPNGMERGAHTAVWDTKKEQLIICGGRKGGNVMTSNLAYDPAEDEWTTLRGIPRSRWFHAASWDPIGEKMYIFGGLNNANQMSARLYRYDPYLDDWTHMSEDDLAPDSRYMSGFVWDPVHTVGLNFGGAANVGNPPISSYNDVMEFRTQVPFLEEGWLTSSYFDVGGILSVGNISWKPTHQASACGPEAVRFQVASSTTLENPRTYLGPDGTRDTYFTDPEGAEVGDAHYGNGRIAYRMYFQTDDDTISPTLEEVKLEVVRHVTKGTYTSPIHDLGQEVSQLLRVWYNVHIPEGANEHLVKGKVKIRTSMDPEMKGASNWDLIDSDDTKFNIPYGRFFQFQVELTTDSIARHLTPVFHSISVEYNSPPLLTMGKVDRSEGDRETWFTYTVTYTDVDNDAPTVTNVIIDGHPHSMSSPDTDYTVGAIYRYQALLPLGEHDYYFEFSDGKNDARAPEFDFYQGPEVVNNPPEAKIDYPMTGERFTPDIPIQFSGSSSKDPERDKITYKWTSSIEGIIDRNSSFIKKLATGEHVITLEVTDAYGASDTQEIALLVKPRLPILEIRDLYISNDRPIERDPVNIIAKIYNVGEVRAGPAYIDLLINDEVVESREDPINVDSSITVTFIWTAGGDRTFVAVAVRHVYEEEPEDKMVLALNVTSNSPPVINMDLEEPVVIVGQPVKFQNNGTTDPNGDQLTYTWDFGDGTTSSEASPQHVYPGPGTYTVNLTVRDTRGGRSKMSFDVTINNPKKEDSPGLAAVSAALAIAAASGLALTDRRRRQL